VARNREAIAEGRDPLAEKRRPGVPTFGEAAHIVHEANLPRWRNQKHALSWIQTLEHHAFPKIGNMSIDTIRRADVLAVLTPIWTTHPETGRRVRQRMRTIFKWAMAHEIIESNPAGEAIDGALPSLPKVKNHLRALHYRETGEALRTIDASGSSPASRLCLKFLILTASRSGEAMGASWDEIEVDGAAWTVPGSRMKSGEEHRVPLSVQALQVLEEAHHLRDGSPFIFPSPLRPGHMLSEMTLRSVLRTTGLVDRATVHGFRTSFRTWTMEKTDTPWEVAEAALAHRLGGDVAQAYARSDLFEPRRALMQRWADYLTGRSPNDS
jgi:integrase